MNEKTNKALQIFLNMATGFLGIFVIISSIAVVSMYRSSNASQNYTDTIEVSGTGKISAVPDIAKISFGHREDAGELSVAQANLEKVISQTIKSLSDLGISEKDIKQQSYNAYPRYEYRTNCVGIKCIDGNRELVAYEVSQNIEVTVRDISKAGEVLAKLAEGGATEISGPYFEIEDRSEYLQEARTIAIQDAREEAKVLAKSLNVRLGRMVDFYENSGGFPTPDMRAEGAGMDMAIETKAVSVPVGEDEIEVQVTLVFKVK